MIVFPNCKINLGLTVLGKRKDGFHELETIFYPVPFTDALEVIERSPGIDGIMRGNDAELVITGLQVDGSMEDNLCLRAWKLLKADFPELPPISIHLHKSIPMGAGLGGGSSDAAFILKLLNAQFGLNLSRRQLEGYAAVLGSDCVFFIINKPCFAAGRGELLEEIAVDLSMYSLMLVNPAIHINTRWAFSTLERQIIPAGAARHPTGKTLKEIIKEPVASWKELLVNDFEKPVFENYPPIEAVREQLYREGAVYAAMTGSGSTVFGLFDHQTRPTLHFPDEYRVVRVEEW